MNIIVQFNFVTGDSSCRYYQVYAVIKSNNHIRYDELEDSILPYFDSDTNTGGMGYEDIVEDAMKKSGLTWEFMGAIIPESMGIYSFWI